MVEEYWLKPLFIVLGIFSIVFLLIEALPATFTDVSWSDINPTVIAVLPWVVVLGLAVAIYVTAVRK